MSLKQELVAGLQEILANTDPTIHTWGPVELPPILVPCAFDRHLRHDGIPEALHQFLMEDIEAGKIPADPVVLCSGKFGELVKPQFNAFTVIHVPGGLRVKGAEDPDLSSYDLTDRVCVFVDDAMYSCQTQMRTERAVRGQGGNVVAAYFGYKDQKNSVRIRYNRSIVQRSDVY